MSVMWVAQATQPYSFEALNHKASHSATKTPRHRSSRHGENRDPSGSPVAFGPTSHVPGSHSLGRSPPCLLHLQVVPGPVRLGHQNRRPQSHDLDLTEGVAKLQHSHLRAPICSSACHTRLEFFNVPQLLRFSASGAQKPLDTQWKTSIDLPARRGRGTGPGTRPVEFTL